MLRTGRARLLIMLKGFQHAKGFSTSARQNQAEMFKVRPAVWIVALLLVFCGCSHAGRPKPPQGPPAAARPRGTTPGPQRQPALPIPSPSAAPSSRLLGAPPPPVQRKVPRLPPGARPRILDVAISQTTIRPGDRVFGSVVTSSNVASVEARIGGYGLSLVKTGVGHFDLTYTVGPLPWFIHGNFAMVLIARNPRGDTATRVIPLTVR